MERNGAPPVTPRPLELRPVPIESFIHQHERRHPGPHRLWLGAYPFIVLSLCSSNTAPGLAFELPTQTFLSSSFASANLLVVLSAQVVLSGIASIITATWLGHLVGGARKKYGVDVRYLPLRPFRFCSFCLHIFG